ncbi:glucose 1-dehydrogenase [Paucibacter sp. R3-3]|uniref:Glucose 1-dehydrogenase n=1 Tax=Roseateles agri TaxID=3098619 RepID=A0ABU5DQT4_9BURK|nr:glucose 1-dehydrogenase [Paucibacter sp. R3-3]MDY0748066.1 glucose 1-dehydrogenase [Paucibacter sp. R3-3]
MEKIDPFRLDGRVALVTGSTMGIGEAIARTLAQAGAHVLISSRKPDECERVAASLRDDGLSAEAQACHIGRMDDIEAMGRQLTERHGGLDLLVNNAVLSPLRSIEDTDLGIFSKTVEVNLRGHWYLSALAARLMAPRGGGSIVNIASIAALNPDRGLALYSTLKTAMLGMTRAFALECGPSQVRVNAVLPGLIKTRLAGKYNDATQQHVVGKTPLGRIGEPEDIAHAVQFLASPAAAFVTGAALVADGGVSLTVL